jgi:hypothetical protein
MNIEPGIESSAKAYENKNLSTIRSNAAPGYGLLGSAGTRESPLILRISPILLALILFGGVGIPAHAQNTAKIIDQYLRAAGGAKAISRIQTMAIEGTFTGADGKAGTFTLNTRSPNRYYAELVAGDQGWIEAYNGKSAWHESGTGGIATSVGPDSAQLEAAGQYYNGRFLNLKKNKIALALLGHAQLRGKDTWQIEVTSSNGVKRQVYFDVATHLITEEKATVGGLDETITYSDYRVVDGVKVPYHIQLKRGDATYQVAVTRAEINGAIPERVFDFPAKSQVKLPDVKALFEKIDQNQKALDKIKENYAGTRTEEETEYDATGKVKKVDTNKFTFFYLNGEEVSTLVEKNGKPLSEQEQKKEDEKTRKEIEKLQKKEAKKEAKEQGKAEKKNDDPGIEVFLRASKFVNPRRERFRGQDVLVFDFEPNSEFQPHELAEKLVTKLAGVVWIDEKALDVARLEAYLLGDVKIAGGALANLQRGTSFVMEQSFVNNEVWLPTYMEAHLGARVLMLKGFKINEGIRYSDYKRFNVDTLATTVVSRISAGSPVN